MTTRNEKLWVAIIGAAGVAVGAIAPPLFQHFANPSQALQPIALSGVIMRSDASPPKRFPIEGVDVSFVDGGVQKHETTNQSGSVTVTFGPKVALGDVIQLRFSHPCYQDFQETVAAANLLYTLYLWPKATPTPDLKCNDPIITRIGLAFHKSTTFEVQNDGTISCSGQQPCSPDGKWKATIGSAVLNAGSGNTFAPGKGSVVCIAGPCPFSQIEKSDLAGGGPSISAYVRNWSDTVTYVLRGELVNGSTNQVEVTGKSFDFSVRRSDLPNVQITAETSTGQSLANDIGNAAIPWASCGKKEFSASISYHCTLAPDYSFGLLSSALSVQARLLDYNSAEPLVGYHVYRKYHCYEVRLLNSSRTDVKISSESVVFADGSTSSGDTSQQALNKAQVSPSKPLKHEQKIKFYVTDAPTTVAAGARSQERIILIDKERTGRVVAVRVNFTDGAGATKYIDRPIGSAN